MTDVRAFAVQAGFSACYVLTIEKFIHYERRLRDGALDMAGQHLVADPMKEMPWANALLFLLTAYRPYPMDAGVSGNYPSSNRAYHSANRLLERLKEQGIRAERIYVPVRELALRSGIGIACKNGLTAYDGFGTRVAVQTLIADLPDVVYDNQSVSDAFRTCPKGCSLCEKACPSGAIDSEGYHLLHCAREYMQKEAMEEWVMDAMSSVLGCELCQFACPLNQQVGVDPCIPDAFDLKKLIAGDVKPALEIVGKNLNAGGRLIAHAIVLAAHGERADLLPMIENYARDPRPAVYSAARYAISHLRESK